uniref:ATP synthase complex subunit 8 n=1 Tax=Profundulus punctatus TaxID=33529 RepID=A0A0N6Y0H7_9TELE|nr:ATPase8 [Profundulus punctatus]
MPQLLPAPWFCILLYVWLVYLYLLPLKVVTYVYPNDKDLQALYKTKKLYWLWPWF